ncbi:hypothetical protein RND71_038545 [Anisodus tanguticus]|uniref:Uncharacterized protein n=1 Tax=Anisodus tanguticus TaxID=243964 RepID=A0AAE1UZ91_9SOLA|nr:hypothetical protein RND71_038545 [Anisodus tanguticus]
MTGNGLRDTSSLSESQRKTGLRDTSSLSESQRRIASSTEFGHEDMMHRACRLGICRDTRKINSMERKKQS